MQTLGLGENREIETENEKSFWRRQFQQKATGSQKKYDWLFGVIMPVICFAFDPIVFTGGFRDNVLADYKSFAYALSFVSVMAMAAWLIWGAKLKWLNALLAGLFIVSSVVALGIGIYIFPLSVLGLLILIGALGFTPLFFAVAFLRNSVRAYRRRNRFSKRKFSFTHFCSPRFSARLFRRSSTSKSINLREPKMILNKN